MIKAGFPLLDFVLFRAFTLSLNQVPYILLFFVCPCFVVIYMLSILLSDVQGD